MRLYLTTEFTDCPTEHSANERMLQLLREYAEQLGILVVDDVNNADMAAHCSGICDSYCIYSIGK